MDQSRLMPIPRIALHLLLYRSKVKSFWSPLITLVQFSPSHSLSLSSPPPNPKANETPVPRSSFPFFSLTSSPHLLPFFLVCLASPTALAAASSSGNDSSIRCTNKPYGSLTRSQLNPLTLCRWVSRKSSAAGSWVLDMKF